MKKFVDVTVKIELLTKCFFNVPKQTFSIGMLNFFPAYFSPLQMSLPDNVHAMKVAVFQTIFFQ